jgi:hypothetical protein
MARIGMRVCQQRRDQLLLQKSINQKGLEVKETKEWLSGSSEAKLPNQLNHAFPLGPD